MVDISAGLGIALNDIEFIGDANANIQLTFDTNIGSDAGYIDHIALFGSNNNGNACRNNPSLANCNGLQVGDLSDFGNAAKRINLDFKTESGITFAELLWPTDAAGESTGIDLQFRLVTTGVKAGLGFTDDFFADITWVKARNIKLEDTSFRLWGSGPLDSSIKTVDTTTGLPTATAYNSGAKLGVVSSGIINASFDLDIDYANSRAITQSEQYKKFPCTSCGWDTAADTPRNLEGAVTFPQSQTKLIGVKIENLRLGYYPYLPTVVGSIERSGASNAPDFFVETPMIPNNSAIYCSIYDAGGGCGGVASTKANISIQRIQMGTPSSNPADPQYATPFFLGHSSNTSRPALEMTGVRVQHLRIETNAN